MSSVLNMLGLHADNAIILEIVLPVVAVIVAFVFLLKLSGRKPDSANKPQSVEKQKRTTNKRKDEKSSSYKKEKINKEKKTLPSHAKAFNVTADTVKSKPNKQSLPSENSLTKNAQTKKQQVNTNIPKNPHSKSNQSNKKQLESFVSKVEEGEWKMVTTKKQKQTIQEEIIETATPTKSGKKAKKSAEKDDIVNKTKKIKTENEINEISTPFVNGETTLSDITEIVKSKVQEIQPPISTTHTPIEQEMPVPERYTSCNAANIKKSEDKTLQTHSQPAVNVAFDELVDDGWTDTKPQRKNRRKALRE